MCLWSRNPATFPVQDNKVFGWNWVSFLSTILLQSDNQGFAWMGKMTNTWKGWKPLKGVLVGFPGATKVESCTNPEHSNWWWPRPGTPSSSRSLLPEPMIGPVKLTMGGMVGKVSAVLIVGVKHMLWHWSAKVTLYNQMRIRWTQRLIALVTDNECWNSVIE